MLLEHEHGQNGTPEPNPVCRDGDHEAAIGRLRKVDGWCWWSCRQASATGGGGMKGGVKEERGE